MWSRWHINVFQQNMTNMTLEEDQNMFRNASVAWTLGVCVPLRPAKDGGPGKSSIAKHHSTNCEGWWSISLPKASNTSKDPCRCCNCAATVPTLKLRNNHYKIGVAVYTTQKLWLPSPRIDEHILLFPRQWTQSFLPLLNYYFAMIASWTHYYFAIIAWTPHHFLSTIINLVNIAGSSTILTAQRLTVLMTCWLFFGWMAMSIAQTYPLVN